MKRHAIAGVVLAGLLAAQPIGLARAQALCPGLTRLLTNPPAGFVEGRLGPAGDQRWAAAPIVPAASCVSWEARQRDADALRCTINDRAKPAAVTAFYTANVASIDRCLAALPALGKWDKATSAVSVQGLRGTETTWVHDTDALRFKISLADYLRTVTDSPYNSFVVEYLKY